MLAFCPADGAGMRPVTPPVEGSGEFDLMPLHRAAPASASSPALPAALEGLGTWSRYMVVHVLWLVWAR